MFHYQRIFFGSSLLSILLYLNFVIMMSILMASMFSLHPSELQHVTDTKDLVFAILVLRKMFLLAFTAGQTSKLMPAILPWTAFRVFKNKNLLYYSRL